MTYIQNALDLLAPTQKGFEIWRSADQAAAWNLEVKEKKTFLPGFSKRKVVSWDSLRKSQVLVLDHWNSLVHKMGDVSTTFV